MALTRRGRRWLVAGVAAVVVLVAGAFVAWRTLFADSTRALGVDEAVEQFRASTTVAASTSAPTSPPATTTPPLTTAPPASTSTTVAPTSLPAPGVYVYATTGQESVDALNGASHTYPAQTTITVVNGGCGVLLRWAPLVERYDEWDLCPRPGGGLGTTGYTTVHTFFGQNDTEHYACSEGTVYLPSPATAGTSWTASCHFGDTADSTVWTVVGTEPVTVGANVVDAVHIHGADNSTNPDGSTSQTTIDLWLRPSDALPLKRVETGTSVNKTAIGDVHYNEHFELQLIDLQPRR